MNPSVIALTSRSYMRAYHNGLPSSSQSHPALMTPGGNRTMLVLLPPSLIRARTEQCCNTACTRYSLKIGTRIAHGTDSPSGFTVSSIAHQLCVNPLYAAGHPPLHLHSRFKI